MRSLLRCWVPRVGFAVLGSAWPVATQLRSLLRERRARCLVWGYVWLGGVPLVYRMRCGIGPSPSKNLAPSLRGGLLGPSPAPSLDARWYLEARFGLRLALEIPWLASRVGTGRRESAPHVGASSHAAPCCLPHLLENYVFERYDKAKRTKNGKASSSLTARAGLILVNLKQSPARAISRDRAASNIS